MDLALLNDLPHEVLRRHILSALPIDHRLAFRVRPNRISKTDLDIYERCLKIQKPTKMSMTVVGNNSMRKIIVTFTIGKKSFSCEYTVEIDHEEICVINKEDDGDIFQIFIVKMPKNERTIHRSHITRDPVTISHDIS
jgi:hypothetical protein